MVRDKKLLKPTGSIVILMVRRILLKGKAICGQFLFRGLDKLEGL